MQNQGKTIAIIAHITLIGWIVAVVMNANEKSEYASFYIRQSLGLFIIMAALSILPFGWMFALVVFLLLVYSLIGALSGKKEPIGFIGQYFQQWFSGL